VDGVIDCRSVGSGRTALKYLAPYIFRVALSNNRLLSMQDGQVTFRYQEGATRQTKTCTLSAEAFLARFLQHVLPKGFVKVRSYGLFRVGARQKLARLRAQLILQQRTVELLPPGEAPPARPPAGGLTCPGCGQEMRLERVLPPQRAPPAENSAACGRSVGWWCRKLALLEAACFRLPRAGQHDQRRWHCLALPTAPAQAESRMETPGQRQLS
jgi:hypothetical protein